MNGILKASVEQYSKFSFTKRVLIFVLATGLFFSCGKNPEKPPVTGGGNNDNCSGPAKSFATDVNPIIQFSCATGSGCHGSANPAGPGSLLTYTQVFNVRSTIRSEVSSGHMPWNSTLSTTQKNAIICWIDNGAPNN